jgi:ketosteroid isomerase-like protein
MKWSILCIPLVSLIFALSGYAGALKDYNARSQDEEEIKTLLLYWQNSGNNGDVKALLSTLTDDFQIHHDIGGSREQVENKKQYGEGLPARMKRNPTVIIGSPNITVTGDKATVKAVLDTTRKHLKATFDLQRQNRNWIIRAIKYTVIR